VPELSRPTASPSRPDRQRGSMTVEFVLLAPLLLGLMLFLVMAGRVVEAHGEADGAARDAARAASVARSLGAAQLAADQAVRTDVRGMCGRPVVQGYQPGSTAVVVTLRCQLDLSFIGYATLPVNGYAVAPLDQFVARSY
jgi:Flp pilus assembly protein TadG